MPPSEPVAPTGARLVVSYQDGADSPAAIAANHTVGARLLRTVGQSRSAVVILPPGADVERAAATLRAQPGVTHVQVDGRLGVHPVRGPRIGD